jgi:hypothetical protein
VQRRISAGVFTGLSCHETISKYYFKKGGFADVHGMRAGCAQQNNKPKRKESYER